MLNKSNFEIAAMAADDEHAPPALTGLYVTPTGTAVCDGHCSITVSSVTIQQGSLFEPEEGVEPADHFTPFVLDRDSALKIAAAIPKKTEYQNAKFGIIDATTEDSERAMVSVNDLQRQEIIRSRKIDGDFPDVTRFTPVLSTAAFTISLGPDLICSVLKQVVKFCNAHSTGTILLSFYGQGKALRIDADGIDQQLVAVVMPQRSDAPEAV